MKIFIEAWQMQCCGDPFKVGDSVEWNVVNNNDGYYYERHGGTAPDKLIAVTGTVSNILAVYRRDNAEEFTVEVSAADGWEKEIDGAKFDYYIVTLD